MSRAKAKSTIELKDYQESMKGIVSYSVSQNTIDESPFAYKDYKEIMECIEPTARVVGRIVPLFNFKAQS